jgi:hypothetical protein
MNDGYPYDLDLHKETLYVWQPAVSAESVDALLRAIDAGATLPRVPIRQQESGIYTLTWDVDDEYDDLDGGHTRAVAYSIADRPLPAHVMHGPIIPPKGMTLHPFKLGDIAIVSDPADYHERKSYKIYL